MGASTSDAMDLQLNELLDAALSLPASERERWLGQLDPQHARLRSRLHRLLSLSDEKSMQCFLGTLPTLAPPVEHTTEPARAHAGPYRLLQKLGSGGMGAVWLAERTDGSVNRCVALKLPQGSWPLQGLAERLTRERDILAVLNHRHIARLYDAGVTADGQPFLALEYVDGKPIDEYCRERAVDLRRRLRLFLQIAEAVAHAHAKLIVHRDLKPANILVTADGHVRLLDFGIAKLVEHDGISKLTELSGRALTLNYAAPEQIAGDHVTTASDIYSLGVVLYELVTGMRPFQDAHDSRRALEHAVLHQEPLRPSDCIAERPLRRAVRGDLDAIILKAMRKEPEARYPTVNAFADDIVQFLSSKPVSAQRNTAWYRARKFVARNRAASATMGLLLLVLSIVILVSVDIAKSVLVDRQRLAIVKTVFADIFQEIDRSGEKGVSLVALERILQAAAREADETMQPQDMMRMRTEARLALVEHHLGKREQSRARLRRLLITLHQYRMEPTAEYAQAKLLEAKFASADRDWNAVELALREASRVPMISPDERVTFDAERAELEAALHRGRAGE